LTVTRTARFVPIRFLKCDDCTEQSPKLVSRTVRTVLRSVQDSEDC
jgi:hypothetical protein